MTDAATRMYIKKLTNIKNLKILLLDFRSTYSHEDIFRLLLYVASYTVCPEGIWKIKSHRSIWTYVISSDKHQPCRDISFINTWQRF